MAANSPIDKGEVKKFAQHMQAEIDDIHTHHDKNSKFMNWASKWNLMSRKQLSSKQMLFERWWFPWVCFGSIGAIWIPDETKIAALYWVDAKHEEVKLAIHKQYWRYTMPAEQYATLMEQLAANVPRGQRVQSSDCPL